MPLLYAAAALGSIILLPREAAAQPSAPSVSIAGSRFTNITTKTDTAICAKACTLGTIVINKVGTADTLLVYNNTACSGALIASITVQAAVPEYAYNIRASVGLCVTSGGGTAGDYTVTWTQ